METIQLKKPTAQISDMIREEAARNNLFALVCTMFASRERNRNTLTPAALKLAMSKRDLNYPKSRYSDILRFMASLGLGKLDIGPRGQVRALNRIPINLKSIGNMVTGSPKQEAPIIPSQQAQPAQKMVTKAKTGDFQIAYTPRLTLVIGKEELPIPGVKKIDPNKLGEFIQGFQELCREFSI